ncbi:hypothetical protein A3H89_00260 [Candidatus Amesbacteria bacterium RIFCSPLOWO2_02_FULL_48_11]|uniref:Peptidase M20 dimerisation domain-containing protein n=3 Tax=Candidatus Amesiibacteriota TaxID=1752730 RepID=A0A1F4Z4G0_9BACT|nr:MAG: hypothetical protein A2V48_05040 [Candidatus Amesbacteria bacterium RBG_19FT_COMBO_48_16]OGC98686.1 MAG: hypothetical protein A2W16_01270 [Candidatus Amesbacteria bacterium RBG_16_48_31]OGD00256.1 MAG: hypothetical protein A2702_03855 [Candidatus Amesbacteria bacterium RIFCSPHIGHO2_01_FULL_48_75]OGD01073.1 MAG: hypothetical protein A3E17_01005 [Candidatus Amesbacteria bacterium RIFCSPHIGHO2_12_FULL_48_14]OGD02593.1 MAG: hypothetical protein A2354_03570 [Candidatus Amesbacteria bacterium
MKDMQVKSLLRELISREDETSFSGWLLEQVKKSQKFDYVKKVKDSRGGLVIEAIKGEPQLIFLCHMDTVKASVGQKRGVHGDRYYGLGAKDMKGGIVSVLKAVLSASEMRNMGLIFYNGEESDRSGMKLLLEKFKYFPKLIVCPESRFVIGSGCKGLMVVSVEVRGIAAHTARPQQGLNSVEGAWELVEYIRSKCKLFKSKMLGHTLITPLFIISWPEFNLSGIVPDKCNMNLELRINSSRLTGDMVLSWVKEFCKLSGFKVEVKLIEEYPVTLIPKKDLLPLTEAINVAGEDVRWADVSLSGFNDGFLLFHKYQIPVVNFGPYGEGNHTANEWVSIRSVEKTAKVYSYLMQIMGK